MSVLVPMFLFLFVFLYVHYNNKAKWVGDALLPASLQRSVAPLKISRDNTKRMKHNIITAKKYIILNKRWEIASFLLDI